MPEYQNVVEYSLQVSDTSFQTSVSIEHRSAVRIEKDFAHSKRTRGYIYGETSA